MILEETMGPVLWSQFNRDGGAKEKEGTAKKKALGLPNITHVFEVMKNNFKTFHDVNIVYVQ